MNRNADVDAWLEAKPEPIRQVWMQARQIILAADRGRIIDLIESGLFSGSEPQR